MTLLGPVVPHKLTHNQRGKGPRGMHVSIGNLDCVIQRVVHISPVPGKCPHQMTATPYKISTTDRLVKWALFRPRAKVPSFLSPSLSPHRDLLCPLGFSERKGLFHRYGGNNPITFVFYVHEKKGSIFNHNGSLCVPGSNTNSSSHPFKA